MLICIYSAPKTPHINLEKVSNSAEVINYYEVSFSIYTYKSCLDNFVMSKSIFRLKVMVLVMWEQ